MFISVSREFLCNWPRESGRVDSAACRQQVADRLKGGMHVQELPLAAELDKTKSELDMMRATADG